MKTPRFFRNAQPFHRTGRHSRGGDGRGSHPLFNPVFVSGNPQEAYAMLESTRSLLIPDTFARTVGLKVGDDLVLVNPSSRERRSGNEPFVGIRGRGRGAAVRGEPWKVAGIISFLGWHWLTKTSGMRVRRGVLLPLWRLPMNAGSKRNTLIRDSSLSGGILLRGLATWNFRTTWGNTP